MDQLIENLRAVLGPGNVLFEPDELLVYECDGLPQHKYRPRAVVFPSTTEDTAAVMQGVGARALPFTPRGAGTGPMVEPRQELTKRDDVSLNLVTHRIDDDNGVGTASGTDLITFAVHC